jgi:hypothetical protein
LSIRSTVGGPPVVANTALQLLHEAVGDDRALHDVVDAARTRGKKLASAHHDLRVQILNVAALLPTRDWKPQMPNV